ncbi:hypothetical protein BpHYR1_048830 [Brachionus plicatilis]|uniref:RNA-directed DNA polymerase from mobile element jockey-like n=1 Tax=Brachionus plicatilis TaxID=10195 RepID=A0A3M7PPJ2_BRAPC|nr:hypothetical protein BpHYR1_048830 [Brachionus plicatilis]
MYYSHKERFWEELKRRRSNGCIVNIGIESLTENFKNLFTTKNSTKPENDEQIQEKLNNYTNLIEKQIGKGEIEVNVQTIKNIIENLPNGKSCGFSEVNNEMLKY